MRRGFLREHYWLIVLLQRIIDISVIVLSAQIAFDLTFGYILGPASHVPDYSSLLLSSVVLAIVVFTRFDVYRPWRGAPKGREIRVLMSAWVTVFVVLACFGFATKIGDQYSRIWVGLWLILGAVLLVVCRIVQRYIIDSLRSNGFNQRHIAIVGDGKLGEDVYRRVSDLNELGFQVRGYFQPGRPGPARFISDDIEAGSLKDFFDFIRNEQVDQVWIAMPFNRINQIRKVLSGLQHSTVDIRLVSDMFGFQFMNQTINNIAGLPVVDLSVSPMSGFNWFLKAFEDRLLALLILLTVSPLMLLLAIGVKMTSTGPIIYRQERLSWNGKPFKMYKFRSMPVDVEGCSGAVWAKMGECRATAFGTFLRKTSLDELPQFWNVLMGDMSIVGPRPERPVFVEKFKREIPGYMQKHLVKAGITGWAQVNGWRGDTDLNKRIEYDLFYINNWSLFLDLKIIWLTLFKGFMNKNAY
ncbi:undecaprenyl-phosphate glucose phosphotransferase [Ketobacter sp. MCCC 1A13808]|uniref:undecaprenyl-phosphate glucose phosphotransferase n=1 Tax=Ketobacter sp. MCCC 1A13808 TaxID=2602738 RepID=UPI0012EBB006|nr:undecaprenyl-phosphate glucose phosphotransferase [Ketobacter sp. MCCC 1A13808]MVF12936.1 undecaprenyl-phosphate glucose phosphotransferase [Ketobacter sp. MCCC 1A13808]